MTKRKGKGGPVDLGDLGESFSEGLLTDAELDALMGEPAFWDLPEADGILGDGDLMFDGCTDWDPFDEDRDLPDGGEEAKGKPKKTKKGRRWNGTNS